MQSLGRTINVSSSEELYLNMKTIPEYTVVKRVAYVQDVKLSTTKFDVGFATFILKDVNSNLVAARLFDLKDFMFSGIHAAELKHKPVIFTCTAQEYNGQISLVIDGTEGISVYDGEFDAVRFIGKVDANLKPMIDLTTRVIETMPVTIPVTQWETSTFDSLCSGKAGGYAKFAEIIYNAIVPYLTADYEEDLLKCYLVTMEYYYNFLSAKEKAEQIGQITAYEQLNAITVRYADDNMKNLYLDCFGALVGVHKPMHLFSHILHSAATYARSTLGLFTKFDTIPFGSKIQLGAGGVELSKY